MNLRTALKEDSGCTGGIENIFYLKPHHLQRWASRGIDNHCKKCRMEIKTIDQLVYTRNYHNKQTDVYCIKCAIPLLDWEAIMFYKGQIEKELKRLEQEYSAIIRGEMPLARPI